MSQTTKSHRSDILVKTIGKEIDVLTEQFELIQTDHGGEMLADVDNAVRLVQWSKDFIYPNVTTSQYSRSLERKFLHSYDDTCSRSNLRYGCYGR